jgi:Protein phosphatase 2C
MLPNAIVRQPYLAALALPEGARLFLVLGLEGTGLAWNPETGRIEGIPETAGEHTVHILYGVDADLGGAVELLTLESVLTIHPDPRSLWIAQPSDPQAPFAKPDSQHQALSHAGLHGLCASQRGRAHAQAGGQREDEALVAAIEGQDWLLAVVADGAGSATLSREGSRLACTCIAAHLQAQDSKVWRDLEAAFQAWLASPSAEHNATIAARLQALLQGALEHAIHAIRDAAAQAAQPEKAFATTVSLALVHPLAQGGHAIIGWGVGDGPVVLLDPSGCPDLLHMPEEGEYGGQTSFLPGSEALHTLPDLLQRVTWRIMPRFQAIVLMTDGVYDPFFQGRNHLWHSDNWHTLWQQWQPLLASEAPSAALLAWLDFWSRGNHDDRSIALLEILEEGQGARGQPGC